MLTPADLDYQPSPPAFAAITADTLGNAATDDDGFNAIVSPVLSDLAGDLDAGANLDAEMRAAAFTPGDLEAAQLAPLAADAQAAVDGIGPAVDALARDVGLEVGPPVVVTPVTPGGGSGGSGGGGGPFDVPLLD